MSMEGDCRRGLMSPVVIDLGGDFSGVIVPGVNVVEPITDCAFTLVLLGCFFSEKT